MRALAALDIPILQGLCLTCDRAWWAGSDEGMSPLDVATQVAVPEFDGRIITVPFSFKETRRRRPAALRRRPGALPAGRRDRGQPRPAAAHPAGRAQDRARAVGVPDQALPDRQRRRPGHPGLADPAAAGDARAGLRPRRAGRDPRHRRAGAESRASSPDTTAGNALIHALIAAGGQDQEWLTVEQLAGQPVRIRRRPTAAGWPTCPPTWSRRSPQAWGEAPGELFVDRQPGPRRRDRGRDAAGRERGDPGPAAARVRREPDRDLPRPRPGADPPLPGGLPLARARVRRARRRPPRQARQPGVAARQERSACRRRAAPTRRSARCR